VRGTRALLEVHDAEAGKASPSFDERGSLLRLVGALPGTDSFEYDTFGVPLASVDNIHQRMQYRASSAMIRLSTSTTTYVRPERSRLSPLTFPVLPVGGVLGTSYIPRTSRFGVLPVLQLFEFLNGPLNSVLPFWVCVCALDTPNCEIDLRYHSDTSRFLDIDEPVTVPTGPMCEVMFHVRGLRRQVRYAEFSAPRDVAVFYRGRLARGCHLRQEIETYMFTISDCVFNVYFDFLRARDPNLHRIAPYTVEGVTFQGMHSPWDYGRGELGVERAWRERWVHFFDRPGVLLRSFDYYRVRRRDWPLLLGPLGQPFTLVPEFVKAYGWFQAHVTVEEVPPEQLQVYWGYAAGVDWAKERKELMTWPRRGAPRNIKRFPFLVL